MKLCILVIVVVMSLVACNSTGANNSASVVEDYLQAKVSSDEANITSLICSELESEINREVASFANVDASIENMACTVNDGDETVTCTGEIIATYGTEDREFPLSTYRVVQEDGEWRWCGESE